MRESIHVLFVDTPEPPESAANSLEREDDRITVQTACSGSSALAVLANGDIDCVISGFDLAGMNGLEFLTQIRDDSDLPFVLLAENGSEELASEAISAGVTDYRLKKDGTVQYSALAERISTAVEQRRDQIQREQRLAAHDILDERIGILDEDGHYRYVTDAYADLYGYESEDLIDKHWELTHREQEIDTINAEMGDEGRWSGETTGHRADGSTFVADHTLSRTDAGELICTTRDITEQKECKQELRRAERRFEATFDNPVSFVGLLDPDGTIRRVNESALEFINVDESAVQGEKFWETPWFDHSSDLQEDLRNAIDRAADGEYVRTEIPHQSPDGETIIMDAVLEPVRNDSGEVVMIQPSGHDITEREKREQALQDAYEIIADPKRSFREQISDLLALGRDTISIDYATFSCVHQDINKYEFELVSVPDDASLQSGDETPLETLPNCAQVVETEEELALQDVAAEAPELTDPEWGIASYLGAPVMAEDDVYGTFCFYDMEVRDDEFADWEVTFVELLSNWVGYELQRKRTTDRLTALNNLNEIARDTNRALAEQSSREEIEQLVCQRLAASDSYEFAWIGTVDEETQEVTPAASADAQAYLEDITITADDGPTGRGPTGTALRTGELQVVRNIEETTQYEPWREQAFEHGITAAAAIPIVYDGKHYGVVNVYTSRDDAFNDEEREVIGQLGEIMGLAIAVFEREQVLEHERERLEFINRLVRHNLLNSLNVVQARADILADNVDSTMESHLETVRDRTEDMIGLIKTLRSLMQVIVQVEDHDLEPVDLSTVLRDEIEHTKRAFPQTEFTIQENLEDAGTVMADDLLGEVFENLLHNAVQHNDAEIPHIAVSVETGAEMATVKITDNGPGVPEKIRERIFRKGEKGFESPGTGFGLYLVQEIIEAYGGAIDVDENDPRGAVFSVTIPRR